MSTNNKQISLAKLSFSNGSLLINLNQFGQVTDLFFPYLDFENQVGDGLAHELGVWVDGHLSWLSDSAWVISMAYDTETYSSHILAQNEKLNLSLKMTDVVLNEANIFVRRIIINNLAQADRELKIILKQKFKPYGACNAHTTFYDTNNQVAIHYWHKRAFLVGGELDGLKPVDFNSDEAGQLSLVFATQFKALESKFMYNWLAVDLSVETVLALNDYIVSKGAGYLIKTTQDFWHAWVYKQNFEFYGLKPEVIELFNLSLFNLRAKCDLGGGIVSSNQAQFLIREKAVTNAVFPKLAFGACLALGQVGEQSLVNRYLKFANSVLTPQGYFLPSYGADQTRGEIGFNSEKLVDHQIILITEDDTALGLVTLWRYYYQTKDLELVESLYDSLIKPSAEFMVMYRDDQNLLPKPSFDLWGENYGVHTYTACAVYAGLLSAANFSRLLGKTKAELRYVRTAKEIKTAILDRLYNVEDGIFYANLEAKEKNDNQVDLATFFALFSFGVLLACDERLVLMSKKIERNLKVNSSLSCRMKFDDQKTSFLATSWYLRWLVAKAKNEGDLKPVIKFTEWLIDEEKNSRLISGENIDDEKMIAEPLIWRQTEFISVIIDYLNKLEEFGICRACNPVK